ncbi:MAG TPA: excinuclease ABC subunit UvrC [Desulfuromonadales bacterium]|nr:excinuclease ABC subunit UvrC [Desulfuromonadales bacterium]
MSLEDKLRQLPAVPGVYIMRDAAGTIIYIGKARSLRPRVRSYFNASGDSRYQVKFLVAKIADIEIILTDTEKEALLLENTLIKQHRPRYNLDLKDDKTYFSLRLDTREKFPRLTVVRKPPRDGARYFGPYSSASAAREVLRQVARMFPLRHYSLDACMARKRPCLYHQIGQCSAPCQGLIATEEYATLVEGVVLFLDGKGRQLVAEFKRRMTEASAGMQYEEAARWRNLLRSIQVTVEKQKVVAADGGDSDVIGFHRDGSRIELAVLFVRGGVLSGSRLFSLQWELEDETVLAGFLQQYYVEGAFIPQVILLSMEIEGATALSELLSELKSSTVTICRPQRGSRRGLVELACKNAAAALRERSEAAAAVEVTLNMLQQKLHLSRLPERIECYDISTIQGRFSVGSRAVFSGGSADTARYRHYRIRNVEGQDDFAMLQEVFSRRFRVDTVEKEGLPDLVVVDGGPGQLNAVLEIVTELGLEGRFDLVSLAKSRAVKERGAEEVCRSDERVFLPGRKNPLVLRQNSAALLLLAGIRDEAHRFAVTYHRTLRGKEGIASGIEQLPGIGPKRRTALLRHFGSLQRLKEATVAEIAAVAGMNWAAAEKLFGEMRGTFGSVDKSDG